MDVDNVIGQSMDDGFHEPLEAGWSPEEPHGCGYPLKLSLPKFCEGSVKSGLGVE
jgi:hypothetical protein